MAPTLRTLAALTAAASAASAFQSSSMISSANTHHHVPRYHSPNSRYSMALRAEVIADADELLDDMREEEEWTTDRERATKKSMKGQEGEVINSFDPQQQQSPAGPLKTAAAYPSDLYEDENKFQGRKPGQPVNRSSNNDRPADAGDFDEFSDRAIVNDKRGSDDNNNDPREQHVVLDDREAYMNDFFQPQVHPGGSRERSGPSVYTREEEDLIAAMGGRGEMPSAKKKRQQNNSVPQPPPGIPPPPMGSDFGGASQQQVGGPQFREEGYLGDSTLREIANDYSIPIPYLADVLATWGAPVPIDPSMRLGDMVTGEQAFAVLEAIHTLDIASLHNMYSEDYLMNICDYYDISVKEAFDFCVGKGWALPFGVRTFLRVEQEEELLDALGGDGY